MGFALHPGLDMAFVLPPRGLPAGSWRQDATSAAVSSVESCAQVDGDPAVRTDPLRQGAVPGPARAWTRPAVVRTSGARVPPWLRGRWGCGRASGCVSFSEFLIGTDQTCLACLTLVSSQPQHSLHLYCSLTP